MSLINDALKRTQQTTQASESPRPDDLELRPIDPGLPPQPNPGAGAKRILWVVVLFVVAGNIALWVAFRNHGTGGEVAAREAETEVAAPAATPHEPDPDASAAAPATAVTPVETGQSSPAPESVAEPSPDRPDTGRPEFRLSTIVYHPVRPSAMINNRVLFVGDKVDGYTVTAIGRSDVTLKSDHDEAVVSLP